MSKKRPAVDDYEEDSDYLYEDDTSSIQESSIIDLCTSPQQPSPQQREIRSPRSSDHLRTPTRSSQHILQLVNLREHGENIRKENEEIPFNFVESYLQYLLLTLVRRRRIEYVFLPFFLPSSRKSIQIIV